MIQDSNQPSLLLIGGTGFIGKVVLERILATAKNVEKVYLLVRSKRDKTPEERVAQLQKLACFNNVQKLFNERKVQIVTGDVCLPSLGLDPTVRKMLTLELSYIISLAACIDFDRPMEEAAMSNATAALNILELAHECVALKRFVHCSTAYVNLPKQSHGAILEEPANFFPRGQASKIYDRIKEGVLPNEEKEMLNETGHPNTYCFTKALAETLLVERKRSVPLVIVRPSIVSACYQHPFPGWIDSKAALAAFIAMYGAGYLHTMPVKEDAIVDVVPCDFVAECLISAAVSTTIVDRATGNVPVIHACAGLELSTAVSEIKRHVVQFYKPTSRHIFQRPFIRVVAESSDPRIAKSFQKDKRRVQWLVKFAKLVRQKKVAASLSRVATGLDKIEVVFSFFTHNTFNFHAKESITDVFPGFDANEYMDIVNMGVYRHLLGGKEVPSFRTDKLQRSLIKSTAESSNDAHSTSPSSTASETSV